LSDKIFSFDDGHLKVKAKFAWLDDNTTPWRLWTWFPSELYPAQYIRYVRNDGKEREVIVHNFYAYRRLMEYWNIDIIEAITLNELHELTHWAIAGTREDEYWKMRDADYTTHHVHYWNPILIEVIRETRR